MDIVKRNFYRKLRAGAYGEEQVLEPMSAFKWKKLHELAVSKGVECFTEENATIPPFSPESQRLPNFFLNYRLEKLRYREVHAIDASGDALTLLNLIIYNTNQILSKGISLRGIIELGRFLRLRGDKVDFVKLELWLQRLYLQPMARMQCSYLIEHFGFTQAELPFITQEIKKPSRLALGAIRFINLCSRRLSEIEE